jgi:murein DD-endopeptidase MepM/ murein hydrolase activator NlpD
LVAFEWPLQKTAGLTFNSYYATNNFVDQDNTAGLEDYNCDMRTYDGHKGTDIDTWPFPWYIYDNDYVEVIAGAAGTILAKTDGNDDDHCTAFGTWNAVYIEHADGSTAWYGHLKRNSLTTKNIGETVALGEYLGVVASSGFSTQPHLHFEVYDSGSNLIDPYAGTCNALNGSTSWWASQPANREPTLNALLTHDAVPVHGCPGANESPNIATSFTAGNSIRFATYYHDQTLNDVSDLRIKMPDNTVWNSWSHTSPSTYTKSWWYWTWNLPSGGPYGTWTFEVDYQGQTYTHSFDFQAALPVELLNFEANAKGQNVLLEWQTLSETNNKGFEVQKSTGLNDWETIEFIEGQGSTSERSSYSFVDQSPFGGNNYYRLKQIDFDGNFEYSEVRFVAFQRAKEVIVAEIAPNPIQNKLLNIYLSAFPESDVDIQIINPLGQMVFQKIIQEKEIEINVQELPSGLYYVVIKSKANKLLVEPVIVQ